MSDEDDLITVVEAARLRQVTTPCVYQWIAKGRLDKETRFGQIVVSRTRVLALGQPAGGRSPLSADDSDSLPGPPADQRRKVTDHAPPAERPKARLIKQQKP